MYTEERIKNIIIINDFAFINGGAGKVALTSAMQLSQKGYNVTIFTAVGPIDKNLIEAGCQVVCLNQYDILSNPNRLYAIKQGIWNKSALQKFNDLLKDFNPQNTIIHFHSWCKSLSSSILAAKTLYKFKIIITLHDYFLFCPNGGLFNYKKQSICHIIPSSFKCYKCNCDVRSYPQKIWRDIRQSIQWNIIKKNKNIHIIYISQLNKEVSYSHLKPYTKDWFLVKNPVDISTNISHINISTNQTYIFMGRLSKEKGAELFCKAITELNLKGCVLGDGYLRETLERKYPNIEFAGWVNGGKKMEYLKKAKALIFPSLWYEGAPLTIIEMKALGIPCIVPDLCSASEEIENNNTGLIFKSGDIEALKKAINIFEKKGPEFYQKNLIENFNPKEFTIEQHCKNLIDVYNQVININ